jgi:hypothetical protein
VATTGLFRDPSAWYHVVFVYDSAQATASNRALFYVNGVQVTSFSSATYPTLNQSTNINASGVLQRISSRTYAVDEGFDGYWAETHFIDGQALTPNSFGQFDPIHGQWTAKKYAGTYGANGFYLDFKDPTSTTTLCLDRSGNGNHWTPNNISVAAGATYDSMLDVPLGSGGQERGNYSVLNPLEARSNRATPSDGNLSFILGAGSNAPFGTPANFLITSKKWYWECLMGGKDAGAGDWYQLGITSARANWPAGTGLSSIVGGFCYFNTGNKGSGGGGTPSGYGAYGASFANGDILGVAFDADSGTLEFYKNGASQGVAYTSIANIGDGFYPAFEIYRSAATGQNMYPNFGQRPFQYSAPSGFKALHTGNLPDPVIKQPNKSFDISLYTGTGAARSVVNAGGFRPALIWFKSRSAGRQNALFDSVRGRASGLMSDSISAELTAAAGNDLASFDSGGFSVGPIQNLGSTNTAGDSIVAWQWALGATPGFDIVTYSGNGTNGRTVAHSLGVAPAVIITKKMNASGTDHGWSTYHKSIGTNNIWLNSTNAQNASNWPTAPTSTVFTPAVTDYSNVTGSNYVNYLWAEIPGFSKLGSYTVFGSADGPFVNCGFRPRFVMVKSSTIAGSNWSVCDTARDTYNASILELDPNNSNAEVSAVSGYALDFTANGFKIRGSRGDINGSGSTFIFMAFAETPTKFALAR